VFIDVPVAGRRFEIRREKKRWVYWGIRKGKNQK
jgi:hypothetical protein